MGDTQWTVPDTAGKNPNTVAVDIVSRSPGSLYKKALNSWSR